MKALGCDYLFHGTPLKVSPKVTSVGAPNSSNSDDQANHDRVVCDHKDQML
jgi:hypothetical protein